MSVLDRLLGRASLRARIDELEEENERLRRRYEAESDRRADAATARQAAEQQQNRLEDRIAQLEGELERVSSETGSDTAGDGPELRARERLHGDRLEEILERLSSMRTGPEGALTAVIGDDGSVPQTLTDALGSERSRRARDGAPCLVCVDDANIVSVTLEGALLPDLEATWGDRFDLEREWFRPTGTFTFALVRADLFALGVYEGAKRVEYRGFESDVKSKHSKGGFSQGRFERIRDGQIDDHLERCREVITEVASGGEHDGTTSTDGDTPLYLVGQRDAVDTLAEDVAPDATAAVDATGKPKSALEDAFHDFWSAELRVL